MYSDIKSNATHNFFEVKKFLQEIKRKEVGLAPDDLNDTSKGLFFVYIYGVYEEIVRKTVIRTIEQINQVGVHISQVKFELLQLVLSNEFDALYNVGNEKKWEKRRNVSEKLKRDSVVDISTALMPTDGKNIRFRQLESIANAFGITAAILPRNEIGGYINEMVDNRNAIAHGNLLPYDVGKRYSSDDLQKKYDGINEFCTYYVEIYERYIVNGEYLK